MSDFRFCINVRICFSYIFRFKFRFDILDSDSISVSDSNSVSKLDLDSISDFDLMSEYVSVAFLDSNLDSIFQIQITFQCQIQIQFDVRICFSCTFRFTIQIQIQIYSTFSDPKPPKLSSIISAKRISNFAFIVIEKIAKEFAKLLKEVSCLIIELKQCCKPKIAFWSSIESKTYKTKDFFPKVFHMSNSERKLQIDFGTAHTDPNLIFLSKK